MRTQQRVWTSAGKWNDSAKWTIGGAAQLVLVFGTREILCDGRAIKEVESAHPNAIVMGCSTAGEICGNRVMDDSLVVTAVQFENTQLKVVETKLQSSADSAQAGADLASRLPKDGLVHVLVLAEGLQVNGSELVKGMVSTLSSNVAVTGGLSADGAKFEQTRVLYNGEVSNGRIVAVGLYGEKLRVGYGSLGGWDSFGPERRVTRSQGNVVYELDGESALSLYKKYLGAYAAELPASGLRFPLSVRSSLDDTPVVRTILSVNEAKGSLTFAGDVPQGSFARLMRANFDRLVDGATGAAQTSQQLLTAGSAELAILISCVGRKLILQQRTEEEVEAVRSVLGQRAAFTGFYSYGEISPFHKSARCELHNQTMTITVFSEAA